MLHLAKESPCSKPLHSCCYLVVDPYRALNTFSFMNGELVSFVVHWHYWYFINHWLTTRFCFPAQYSWVLYPPLDLRILSCQWFRFRNSHSACRVLYLPHHSLWALISLDLSVLSHSLAFVLMLYFVILWWVQLVLLWRFNPSILVIVLYLCLNTGPSCNQRMSICRWWRDHDRSNNNTANNTGMPLSTTPSTYILPEEDRKRGSTDQSESSEAITDDSW